MEELISITYADLKQRLDREMTTAAASFIRIGYLLRMARDTDALAGSGYDNVMDFAKAEYGLDRSQVSRFIRINERFGNGDALQDNYAGFGSSKLAEMLLLPDMVAEDLPWDASKTEIRELAADLAEDRKTTDLELMMEDHSEEPVALQAFREYFGIRPEEYVEVTKNWRRGYHATAVLDTIAPTGQAMKTIRLSGLGKVCISFRGSRPVSIIVPRTGMKEEMSVGDFAEMLSPLFANDDLPPRAAWELIYNRQWPGSCEDDSTADEPGDSEPEAGGHDDNDGERQIAPVQQGTEKTPGRDKKAGGNASRPQKKVIDIVKPKKAEEPEQLDEREEEQQEAQTEAPVVEFAGMNPPEPEEPAVLAADEDTDADEAGDQSAVQAPIDAHRAMINEITRCCRMLLDAATEENWVRCKGLLSTLKDYVESMQRRQAEGQVDGQMEVFDYPELIPGEGEESDIQGGA